MARKRKSDPIPLRKSKDLTPLLRLPQSDTDTNSSVDNSNNSGEELEKLISVIHDKFKKKTKEQQSRSEEQLKATITSTIDSIKTHVDRYENELSKQLEQLKENLRNIQNERANQVLLFKQRYRELKEGMSGLIKSIESYDDQYRTFVEGFITSVQSIESEIHENTLENLAVVPSSVQRFAKLKRHKK